MTLSMATRKQVTKEMAQRYRRARKRMLGELCALTGHNRSYAARLSRLSCLRARSPAMPAVFSSGS